MEDDPSSRCKLSSEVSDTKIIQHEKDVSFFQSYEITSSNKNKIRELWEKSFRKNSNDDMELLDTTIVGFICENNKIVAMSFLLCPTKEQLSLDEPKSYSNIKEQGVTPNDCYIYNFCVSKSKRKKGYGKFLLQECHSYLSGIKKQKVLLFVEHGNIPAICLYNKFGYKVHRATPGGFIMEKNLQ